MVWPRMRSIPRFTNCILRAQIYSLFRCFSKVSWVSALLREAPLPTSSKENCPGKWGLLWFYKGIIWIALICTDFPALTNVSPEHTSTLATIGSHARKSIVPPSHRTTFYYPFESILWLWFPLSQSQFRLLPASVGINVHPPSLVKILYGFSNAF